MTKDTKEPIDITTFEGVATPKAGDVQWLKWSDSEEPQKVDIRAWVSDLVSKTRTTTQRGGNVTIGAAAVCDNDEVVYKEFGLPIPGSHSPELRALVQKLMTGRALETVIEPVMKAACNVSASPEELKSGSRYAHRVNSALITETPPPQKNESGTGSKEDTRFGTNNLIICDKQRIYPLSMEVPLDNATLDGMKKATREGDSSKSFPQLKLEYLAKTIADVGEHVCKDKGASAVTFTSVPNGESSALEKSGPTR